ncbi:MULTISPECIES: hypothetical protein [unclassified Microcoleus]
MQLIVGLDRLRNVNYLNPFFFTFTGYTHKEILGNNWFDTFLPCEH